MKSNNENQLRHEMLINFLSQFKQYQYDGKPKLKIVKDQINSVSTVTIDTNDINTAVVVFTDTLNLYGGSMGNIDLYELLQTYLTNPQCRDKINKIVSETKQVSK